MATPDAPFLAQRRALLKQLSAGAFSWACWSRSRAATGDALAATKPPVTAARAHSALNLSLWQAADGSIATRRGGDALDPYFAMKGLLTAHQLGLDVSGPAKQLIDWMLPRQRVDGSFERYCLHRDTATVPGTSAVKSPWMMCHRADADDSMLALWMQLLCTTGIPRGAGEGAATPPVLAAGTMGSLPAQWLPAFLRAQKGLQSLRSESGTFNISVEQPVQLLMDNAEIWECLRVCAERFAFVRNTPLASEFQAQVQLLQQALLGQFWQPAKRQFRISSQDQKTAARHFYPDAAAQLFPLMAGIVPPNVAAASLKDRWISAYAKAWLAGDADEYPWGVLVLAFPEKRYEWISKQWLKMARPLRETARWNILEECVLQSLEAKLRA